ncbi:MAG: YfhO family protein [Chitinispirillales bacterium]|jgi:hypothetical protein|nr:YfhO family protein [Chitinispirillales bacterium]
MSSKSVNVKKNTGKTAPVSGDGLAFRHWSWVCAGMLFLVTALFFSSFIFSDRVLASTNSDQLSNIDMKELSNLSLRRNWQVPAWFSTRLGGMPAIDAMFGDALYPPSMLVRVFTPTYRSFGFVMVLHVFLAGLFFFVMLRRSFGAARLAAFAGALFYMLSPQFVSHVSPGHDGKMIVIAWLPYVVWRLRSLLSLPSLRNAALMATGVAMMILSPHVQMTYFVLMGIFLYWAADVIKAAVEKTEKKRVAGKAAYFWISVFMGMGASFIVLYPSYMFVKEAFSVRGIDRGFEFATSWSMGWAEFFSLWVHEFGNALDYYWGKNYFKLNTEYAGAIPLLLAVLAVASKPKSFWRLFWAGVAVLAVLYSMGANTPFFTAAYHLIPGVKRFRAPSMIMFWFTFGTALMSVFFIKDLLNKRFNIYGEPQRKWTAGLAAALGGVTLITILFSVESFTTRFAGSMMGDAGALRVFRENFTQKFIPNLWLWWLFASITLGMLLAVVQGRLRAGVLVYSLIAMGMTDTIKVNLQFLSAGSPQQFFYRNEPTLKELSAEFARAPFRVFSLRGTYPLQHNQEGVYGLEGIGGFHDNELNCYRAFRGDQGDSRYLGDIVEMTRDGQMRLSMAKITGKTPFLDLAGVDYILMASGTGKVNKIKNPTSPGRLSYAPDFIVLPEAGVVDALKAGYYDYTTTVALLEEPELPFTRAEAEANTVDTERQSGDAVDTMLVGDGGKVSNGGNDDGRAVGAKAAGNAAKRLKVEWKMYTPNRRIAAVTMPDDGFLRISEVYYPGWRIKVDGVPVKYYRSDMAWMSVPLKAGDYEIVMEPRSLYLGAASKVSAVFTLIIVGILAYGFVRGRREKGAA